MTERPASSEYVETLVIGGGQSGLVDRLPPLPARPRRSRSSMPTTASATPGATGGTRSGCSRPTASTGCPACRFPGTTGGSRARTRWPTIWSPIPRGSTFLSRPVCGWTDCLGRATASWRPAGSRRFEADNVVVAMSSWQRPRIPDFASQLDPRIVQLHVADYRNPGSSKPEVSWWSEPATRAQRSPWRWREPMTSGCPDPSTGRPPIPPGERCWPAFLCRSSRGSSFTAC